MNLRICSSRSTTTASVGVCTRPTVVRKKPPARELKAVMARVPLMPTSQSASERLRAALARPAIWLSLRSLSKPSRMAWGVIDCSHRRLTGLPSAWYWPPFWPPAYCSIRRKISSPSRPASQALMRALTSLRLASLTTAFRRLLVLSTGFRWKKGGITGRLAKLHLPRLTSNCSGAWISTRCPTALVTTKTSFSKGSSNFSNLPVLGVSARTMSCATDGFSAITRVFVISASSLFKVRPEAGLPASYNPGFARMHAHTHLCVRTRRCSFQVNRVFGHVRKSPLDFRSPHPDPPLGGSWPRRVCPARHRRGRDPDRVRGRGDHLAGGARPPPARSERPEPHLLFSRRCRPRDRCAQRRQLLALDQPQLRPQLHRR